MVQSAEVPKILPKFRGDGGSLSRRALPGKIVKFNFSLLVCPL